MPDQAHPFPRQRFTDLPALSVEIQLALRSQGFDFQSPPDAARVQDAGRSGAGSEAQRVGGGLHVQCLMRSKVVVLVTELVQPFLVHFEVLQTPAPRHLQRKVKAFHLALSLGMANPR